MWFLLHMAVLCLSLRPISRLHYLTSTSEHDLWSTWKLKYHKAYEGTNEIRRKLVFLKNLKDIQLKNSQRESDEDAYFDLDQFSDLTETEFMETVATKKAHAHPKGLHNNIHIPIPHPNGPLPENYSACGQELLFGSIKDNEIDFCKGMEFDQGGCGSCFSVSNAMALQIKYANLTYHRDGVPTYKMMSPQQLLDCEVNGERCRGGYADGPLDYSHYISLADDYPYYSGTSPSTNKGCQKGKKTPMKLSYTLFDDAQDVATLKQIVHHYGSFVSCVKPIGWSGYAGGILKNVGCSKNEITTHVIGVVGYGRENGVDYIIVRNSWGKNWGLGGYIKLAQEALCGIGGNDNEDIPISLVHHVAFSDVEAGPYGTFRSVVDVQPVLYNTSNDPAINPVHNQSETPSEASSQSHEQSQTSRNESSNSMEEYSSSISEGSLSHQSNDESHNNHTSNDTVFDNDRITLKELLAYGMYAIAAGATILMIVAVIILHLSLFF
ncbi:viral cathepsin, putative [Entamoeba invadens IP1]|uniref:viral cathepsin, putative n=1 Tax=Entamoeba invadens IP1 TaxID=370355 RepID=UPI0002C3E52A|nr:viral cathepsin, putative [Entamoeba invadens IP1]ELP85150.1 viral cathepsin, putative [Entamoeba invadens IP1]|eukprot:XP_004184496.1 viral cathepsin, putative [Entamoeba invadens IP1]